MGTPCNTSAFCWILAGIFTPKHQFFLGWRGGGVCDGSGWSRSKPLGGSPTRSASRYGRGQLFRPPPHHTVSRGRGRGCKKHCLLLRFTQEMQAVSRPQDVNTYRSSSSCVWNCWPSLSRVAASSNARVASRFCCSVCSTTSTHTDTDTANLR